MSDHFSRSALICGKANHARWFPTEAKSGKERALTLQMMPKRTVAHFLRAKPPADRVNGEPV